MDFSDFKSKYQKVEVLQYPTQTGDKPLVSVCVQTYQHAPFIRQCLDGILMQQTTFQFEILLGEDASTDGTREICIEYANQYPDKIRLFLHHRENNIRINDIPTGRFNFTYNLFSAKGKYIALCDGDDYWTDPLKLQKQVAVLESNSQYVLTFTKVKSLHPNGKTRTAKILDGLALESFDFTIHDYASGLINFYTCSVMLRNILNQNIPTYLLQTAVADMPLFLHSLQFGKIKYLPIITAVYRVHAAGIWSGRDSSLRCVLIAQLLLLIKSNFDSDVQLVMSRRVFSLYNDSLQFALKDQNKFKVYFNNYYEFNADACIEFLRNSVENSSNFEKILKSKSYKFSEKIRSLKRKIVNGLRLIK